MEKTKLGQMNDILNKLEDIKNSENSLIEKIGSLEVDLFNCPDEKLGKTLDEVLGLNADASEQITNAIEAYSMEINRLKSER